jgi:hypothetical protein
MFVQKLNQVTEQLRNELPGRNPVNLCLIYASKIWCNQLNIPQYISNSILEWYKQHHEIEQLTTHIYQEWKPKEQEEKNWLGSIQTNFKTSKLYNLVMPVLQQANIRNGDMQVIAIIAFGIVAVGYFIHTINQQQATKQEEKLYEYASNPVSYPVQNITKQFLALVISASKEEFLKSVDNKGRIDFNVGEELYEMTNYLWLGSETTFNQSLSKINHYLVSKGNESEYDIHLVSFELKQADEGFKPNVNQLDRYDAFCKLSDLVVNFEISPRLRMEAYENFEVYNR